MTLNGEVFIVETPILPNLMGGLLFAGAYTDWLPGVFATHRIHASAGALQQVGDLGVSKRGAVAVKEGKC